MTQLEARVLAGPVCAFALIYANSGLFRHWHFDSAFDLAIFDQAVWHLSRFEAPASTIKGISNIFGDHFSPVLLLFAPLYWIVAAPETLIGAQAALLALSIVPVYLFLRDKLPRHATWALTAAYGLFWGVQRTALFDVHEVAFAPLLIATAILAMDRRQWWLFGIALTSLAFVKEDLLPLMAMFGVYLFLRGERRTGVVVLISSLAGFAFVLAVAIPLAAGSDRYPYTSAYEDVLRRPWLIPATLFTPATKLRTALLWVAPFSFLPLFSPLSSLLMPLVLERFLSASPNHWGVGAHYAAPLAPILAMSAGDGLARLARRVAAAPAKARLTAWIAGASVLLSALLPGHQPLLRLFAPQHYQFTAFHRSGYRALQTIPASASVAAQASVAPHLTHRNQIYLLGPDAPDVDVVIASDRLGVWPYEDQVQLSDLVDQRRRRGYQTVFEENGWIVLRRPQ